MAYMAATLAVKSADRAVLEQWLRTHSLPQAWSLRAKIVLASAAGEGVREMARRLETTTATVCLWRRRYRSQGLAGLQTQPRSGRPRRITEAKERAVISATLRTPRARTHRRTRRLAK